METPPSDSNNQLPQPISGSAQQALVATCGDVSNQGDKGPTAGSAAITLLTPTGTEVNEQQDLYLRGEKIGTASEFIMFGERKIIKPVAYYLHTMIEAAKKDGTNLRVNSGFRTMAQQRQLRADMPNLAARAGYSNHQNGIAVDFSMRSDSGKSFQWLTKNAWRYGFIRTVIFERWHWEYWGDWKGAPGGKPEWAKHSKWGANGHQPRTMYAAVPRIHAVSVPPNGGRSTMPSRFWWGNNGAGVNHTDNLMGGKFNSWIGYNNQHLPDYFDQIDPNWNK